MPSPETDAALPAPEQDPTSQLSAIQSIIVGPYIEELKLQIVALRAELAAEKLRNEAAIQEIKREMLTWTEARAQQIEESLSHLQTKSRSLQDEALTRQHLRALLSKLSDSL
jgi:hypothetical protein